MVMVGNERQVLTAGETAEYLRLSVATVYRLAQEGSIPAVRVGRVWRFPRRLLDEWLEREMRANGAGEGVGGTGQGTNFERSCCVIGITPRGEE